MSSLSLAATALLVFFGEQPVIQKTGEEYSPKGGNFTIRFPAKPKESTQKAKSPIGEVDVFAATCATNDGNVYMVSYSDLPEKATRKENLDTLFEGVREGAKGDGTVRVCDKIEFGPMKLPGRELKLMKDKQWVRMYAIVRDNRLYQIAAVGSQSFAEGKEANAFLESFQLISK
ncbi:MAG TPA: hypothetical protein VG097_20035 [Gemmata sp.]|nr:hypothetical protein [Gemmata sp.]